MDAPLELLFKISHFVTKSLSLFNALEKQITVFYYRATTKWYTDKINKSHAKYEL